MARIVSSEPAIPLDEIAWSEKSGEIVSRTEAAFAAALAFTFVPGRV